MDDKLKNRIWSRDKGVCQNCQKKLLVRVHPNSHEKVIEKLSSLKEIPIYKWSKECWKCQKETPIVSYSFEVVFSPFNIGDIEKLDKILRQKYSFVKKTFSKKMGEVIANTCVHCGSLQGNWYVMEDLREMVDYENVNRLIDIVLPNNLVFEDLYDPEDFRTEPFLLKLPIGRVHHKDGNPENNSPDNLVLLCSKCHGRVHSGSRDGHVSYYKIERERRRQAMEKKQVGKWRKKYYAKRIETKKEKSPEQRLLLENEQEK